MKFLIVRGSITGFILLALSGCSGGSASGTRGEGDKPPVKPAEERNPYQENRTEKDIKQLTLAYSSYHSANDGKGPKRVEDLEPFFDNDKRVLEALKSGTLVINFGIEAATLQEDGASDIALVYEKDVPSKGGYVGFADMNVKKIRADEFKKAIVAKKP